MKTRRVLLVACLSCAVAGSSPVPAQVGKSGGQDSSGGSGAPLPTAAPGDQVIVKREAIDRIDPQKYRAALSLAPIEEVTVVAPFDGIIRDVAVKVGQQTKTQAELVRLDNTVQTLKLKQAQALYKAALLEQKLVSDKASNDQRELAGARSDAAKAAVDLAQHELDQASIRAPFAGDVLQVLVTGGQFVRAGDAVAVVAELSRLKVEVPAERAGLAPDQPFPIKVDAEEVEAKVQAVLPLNPRFDALRELFESVASGVLVIDNAGRKFQPGQTVHVPLIPRHPVAEVPSGAIGNTPDGQRKVQVLRSSVVRDLPVTLMGPVGAGRLYVSGAFSVGDEVIYEASHLLADGFPLKPGKPSTKDGRPGDTKPTGAAGGF